MNISTTPDAKLDEIEGEFESYLDSKSYLFDDGHVYDEPLKCLQAQPLPPLSSLDFKNSPSHSVAPPLYSSTIKFQESVPLADSTMLENPGEKRGRSSYSQLNFSEMPHLEYRNVGNSSRITTTNANSGVGRSASQGSDVTDYSNIAPPQVEPNSYAVLPSGTASNLTNTEAANAINTSSEVGQGCDVIDYTNVVPHQAQPNPYAVLPSDTASNSTHKETDDDKTATKGAGSAECSHVQTYEIPKRRQSDYQQLISGERSDHGEYTQASPRHESSGYDVPRNSQPVPQPQQSTTPGPLTSNGTTGDQQEKYVNAKSTDVEIFDDMYVKMSSAPVDNSTT